MRRHQTAFIVLVVVLATASAASIWDPEFESSDSESPFDSLRERLSRDLWSVALFIEITASHGLHFFAI